VKQRSRIAKAEAVRARALAGRAERRARSGEAARHKPGPTQQIVAGRRRRG
jgi:hypothetical protein